VLICVRFQFPRLSVTDKRALHHILVSEPYKFPKPNFERRMLEGFLGHGIFEFLLDVRSTDMCDYRLSGGRGGRSQSTTENHGECRPYSTYRFSIFTNSLQNPSFGPAHIKLIYPTFMEKAAAVRPFCSLDHHHVLHSEHFIIDTFAFRIAPRRHAEGNCRVSGPACSDGHVALLQSGYY
jgi:hypothetical protein